jgi:hypothetical protein
VPGKHDDVRIELPGVRLVGAQHLGGAKAAHGEVQHFDAIAARAQRRLEARREGVAQVELIAHEQRVTEERDAAGTCGLAQRKIVIRAHTLTVDTVFDVDFRRVMPVDRVRNVTAHSPGGAGHIARHHRLRRKNPHVGLTECERVSDERDTEQHAPQERAHRVLRSRNR